MLFLISKLKPKLMLCRLERLMNLEEFLLSTLDCARIFEYISDTPSVPECLKPQLWSPSLNMKQGGEL